MNDVSTEGMASTDALLQAAVAAAEEAGEYLLGQLGKAGIREKNPRDFVTEADLAAQSLIARRLLGQFPGTRFLGEEKMAGVTQDVDDRLTEDWSSGDCWIVDPIDGTLNFIHQLPGFSVSIGLFRNGQPLLGVVRDPTARETFAAVRGKGAWRNGEPARVSRCEILGQSLLVCSFPPVVTPETVELIRFNRVVQHATMRRFGSAALNLCYVGCGRLDGYWASTLNLWDLAGGMLFALEGGACVTHLSGGPLDFGDPQFLAACTSQLHARLLPILQID